RTDCPSPTRTQSSRFIGPHRKLRQHISGLHRPSLNRHIGAAIRSALLRTKYLPMSPTGLLLPATHSISPDKGLSQAPVRLKALIFDLDGTLYRQGPLRRAIALRLLRAYALKPAEAVR